MNIVKEGYRATKVHPT